MFEQIYNDFLHAKNEENQKERSKNKQKNYFSASSAGSCLKKQYYLVNDTPISNAPSDESLAKMRLGTIIHADFENAMKHRIEHNNIPNIVYYAEHPILIDEWNLQGTLDMAVHIMERDTLIVADLKSIASYPYKLRFGRDKAKNAYKVSTNYELQVCTYAIGLNDEVDASNIDIQLLYYNKDTSRFKTVPIHDSFMDEAAQYWEEVNDVIEEMEQDLESVQPHGMVGVPFADWECRYCQFQDQCI